MWACQRPCDWNEPLKGAYTNIYRGPIPEHLRRGFGTDNAGEGGRGAAHQMQPERSSRAVAASPARDGGGASSSAVAASTTSAAYKGAFVPHASLKLLHGHNSATLLPCCLQPVVPGSWATTAGGWSRAGRGLRLAAPVLQVGEPVAVCVLHQLLRQVIELARCHACTSNFHTPSTASSHVQHTACAVILSMPSCPEPALIVASTSNGKDCATVTIAKCPGTCGIPPCGDLAAPPPVFPHT